MDYDYRIMILRSRPICALAPIRGWINFEQPEPEGYIDRPILFSHPANHDVEISLHNPHGFLSLSDLAFKIGCTSDSNGKVKVSVRHIDASSNPLDSCTRT